MPQNLKKHLLLAILGVLEGFLEKSEESRLPLKLKNNGECFFQKIWYSQLTFSNLCFHFQDNKSLSKMFIIPWRIFSKFDLPFKSTVSPVCKVHLRALSNSLTPYYDVKLTRLEFVADWLLMTSLIY